MSLARAGGELGEAFPDRRHCCAYFKLWVKNKRLCKSSWLGGGGGHHVTHVCSSACGDDVSCCSRAVVHVCGSACGTSVTAAGRSLHICCSVCGLCWVASGPGVTCYWHHVHCLASEGKFKASNDKFPFDSHATSTHPREASNFKDLELQYILDGLWPSNENFQRTPPPGQWQKSGWPARLQQPIGGRRVGVQG